MTNNELPDSVSRRSILRATGAATGAAVAGGAMAGSVAATHPECTEREDYLGEASRGRCGHLLDDDCEQVEDVNEANTVLNKASTHCFGEGYEPDDECPHQISHTEYYFCPEDNGNGDDDPVFTGCSQVCGVSDPSTVNVVYSEGSNECESANWEEALQEGGRGDDCWEIVSDDYKIIGVGDVDNDNQCAQVCFRDE